MSIVTFSLQSGSNGNAIYVETPDARLLFDAGISGKTAAARMAMHGRDIRDCDAVIVSHDHGDHVRCAGIYSRKFELPLLMTKATYQAASLQIGPVRQIEHFIAGQSLRFGHTKVETIPTPHDAVDGAAFIISVGGKRLGILTDLGHVFDGLSDLVGGLHGAYLETNYDPEMLRTGSYPVWLKQRIAGPEGHLSNGEAAALAAESGRRLRWLALAHLSEENNQPGLALKAARQQVGQLPIDVAGRNEVSKVWEV